MKIVLKLPGLSLTMCLYFCLQSATEHNSNKKPNWILVWVFCESQQANFFTKLLAPKSLKPTNTAKMHRSSSEHDLEATWSNFCILKYVLFVTERGEKNFSPRIYISDQWRRTRPWACWFWYCLVLTFVLPPVSSL